MAMDAVNAEYCEVLQALHLLRMRARFLPLRHPSVVEAADLLHGGLGRLLRVGPAVTVVVRGGEFFVNGMRLPNESLLYEDTARALAGRGVRSLDFLRGVEPVELGDFVGLCFAPDGVGAGLFALPHVRVNQHDVASGGGAQPQGIVLPESDQARDAYRMAIGAVVGAFYDSRQRGRLNVSLVENMVASLHEGMRTNPDMYLMVSQLREFSEYTFFHSVNVAILSMLLGSRVGLDVEQVRRLGVAAMLHDVGKAHVPRDILEKPGRLDDAERGVMEKHPADSVLVLAAQPSLHPASLAVAAQHHVGYDMKGYPNFSGVGDLHLFSHIVTIADVYDALRSERSYKKSMLPDKAMLILLEGMGKTFHPTLLKAFLRMVGPFPPGTLVELDSGELGVVTHSNPRVPFRPRLRLLGAPGEKTGALRTVDLAQENGSGGFARSILRALDPAQYGISVGRVV